MINTSGETENVTKAWELLDVTSEAELRKFLGELVAAGARRSGGLSGDVRQALIDRLAETAQWTVPTLTAILGAGPAVGGWQASPTAMASQVYGLSLEGISAEDRDYEIARQFVRFAQAGTTAAAHRAAAAPAASTADAALVAAARKFAPGLAPPRQNLTLFTS
jgi:hypothetical protein